MSARYKNIMKTFGQRLKAARMKRYPSAQQFANAAGIEPHTYRKYERGQAECNFETLTRFCELLDITPNDLFPHAAQRGNSVSGSSSASAAA
ncbi:helix-turn-helix transcriptional regulator [uncultured Paracoccus sp.]|uniref:helix-turn-helix domain-containing protein n=1 Tax=uncultured Paracoccus sp. TaxID=189685 RepID=UPI00260D5507|nr:helix-turn-helix transcriptional regulator [uncultured Paracoccus sp.]